MYSYFMVLVLSLLNSTQVGKPQFLPSCTLLDNELSQHCIHLSSDGRHLAVAGGSLKGGDWKVFDLRTGKCIVNGLDSNQRCWGAWGVCLSGDNSMMAVGGNRNFLFIVHTATGKLYWDLTNDGHVGAIKEVYFTPDNKYLVTTSGGDMMMRVWDIRNKRPHAVFRFTSPNSNLNQWKSDLYVEKAKYVYEIEGIYRGLYCCKCPSDGRIIAVAGNLDSKVLLLDLTTGKVVKTIDIQQRVALSLEFTTDGKWLLVGGSQEKGMIEIWDIEKNELVISFGRHEGGIGHLAISPDKKTIVSGGGKDGFRVWDVATGKQKFSYFTKEDPRMPRATPKEDPKAPPYLQRESCSAGVAFLPDGKTFLIAPHWTFWNTEVYFYDTATGEPVDYRKRVSALPQKANAPR